MRENESDSNSTVRVKQFGLIENVPWNILESDEYPEIEYVGSTRMENQGCEVVYRVYMAEKEQIEIGGHRW